MSTTTERVVKVLVLGDAATGKTSIIKQYVYSTFSDQHIATTTVDFNLKLIQKDDITYRVQLWDIAGQDRFQTISRVYYRDALAAFIVCDNTRPETLANVSKWREQVGDKTNLPNGKPLPVMLLVNKCDIEEKSLTDEEIKKVCEEHSISSWMRTSAKTGMNINECMNQLLEQVWCMNDIWGDNKKSDAVSPVMEVKDKKGCCA